MSNNFHNSLHEKDEIDKTYGYRHTNSKICKNNLLPNKCAFVREDNICMVPPVSWKRQYQKLKSIRLEDE